MRLIRPFAVLVHSIGATLTFPGCGSQESPLSTAAASPANVTGAWRFTGTGTNVTIAAGLVDTVSTVAGTATVYGCGTGPEQTTVNGSVTKESILTLKTAPLAGGAVLILKGQISADGKSTSDASLASSGDGCTISETTGLKGQVYAPASGSYSGTFVGSDGDSSPVTAILTQSSSPGGGGSYTLSGSVSFPASPCLATATLNTASSTVTGGDLSATYNAIVNGSAVTITATGTADPDATHVTIANWTITGGPCDGYSGTGSLSD